MASNAYQLALARTWEARMEELEMFYWEAFLLNERFKKIRQLNRRVQ